MGHTLHHQGLNLDEELLFEERARDRAAPGDPRDPSAGGEAQSAGEARKRRVEDADGTPSDEPEPR
jgi:hypothetical protein